ncbi:two-component sensor histidine kinase [Kitasatospora xanthocidica]|uniref:histidine kinase n=1 Tax=Kitasatospora xanthocidica TaxID=83382 RepID=A0A373A016_9ACTN|nr:histidine kinase [Kitasatospora xanthocidica]RGD61391.1 two-component sensor histidine kinase [Kitasatospora xanthocidica]
MPLPFPALSPRRQDQLIALCGLLGGSVLIVFKVYDRADRVPLWAVVLPLVVLAGLELVRRTRPVLAVSLGGLAFAGSLFAGSLLATLIMYTDLLYAAVIYGTPRMSRVLHLSGGATVLALSTLAAIYGGTSGALLVVVVSSLVFLAPVWTGDVVRKHREEAEAERLRAEQTALLSEMDRREAIGAERARMARELHDVVANHLSAIAIHATGAQSVARRRSLPEDDPLVEVLAVIRENSVQGLAEMRRMIGLLRDSGGGEVDESYAAPDLAAVDALLAKARAAGQDVGLDFELSESGERGDLPVPVGLAAYRIVQESLTNALKHAGPGLVSLRLEFAPEELRIAVDSPYRGGPGRGLPGARAGLVGMAERAGLLGGSFEAGPRDGYWRVRAVLPRAQGNEGRA